MQLSKIIYVYMIGSVQDDFSDGSSPSQPVTDCLGDADVLNVEVSFCQKAQTFGVFAVFTYCDALVFGVDGYDCHFFAISSFGDAYFSDCCWFEGIFHECYWVFAVFDYFVLFPSHSLKSVDVSAAFSYGNAHLALVDDEYCPLLYFVNNTVFHAGAANVFKQSYVTHFVAGDFYAGCQFFSSIYFSYYCSIILRISESPVSRMLKAEIMKSLLHTSAKSIEPPLYVITGTLEISP